MHKANLVFKLHLAPGRASSLARNFAR